MAILMQWLLWIGAWAGIWYGVSKFLKSKGTPGWLGHVAGGALGMVFSMIIVGIAMQKPEVVTAENTATAPHGAPVSTPVVAKSEAVVSVSAGQLYRAYHANEVSADTAYRDKALLVSGSVMDITKDLFDNVSVSLRTPNEFMPARAQVEESEHGKASALRRGQQITLACTGAGMLIGSPMLDDCHIK